MVTPGSRRILAAIAIGDESYWLTESVSIPVLRNEVQRKATMSRAELEQEQAKWVAAAPNDDERSAREFTAEFNDVEDQRDMQAWGRAGLRRGPSTRPSSANRTRAREPVVCISAVYALAWFPEERHQIIPALTRVIVDEPEPEVRANACVAAARCAEKGDQTLIEIIGKRRGSTHELEHWSAVLALAMLTPKPDRTLVEDLYACLITANGDADWQFLGGDVSGFAALVIRDLAPVIHVIDR